MKKTILILLTAGLLIPTAALAQKNKKKNTKKANAVEEVNEDPRIAQMLAATQKIIFIDSLVVNLNDFIKHIPLTTDCGSVSQTGACGQFTNELKDYRLTAIYNTTDSACHLHESNYIGNQWTAPQQVKGIDQSDANFPFMMPDGVTLYFAQKGEKSIGGYDIFVTRYDGEEGTFLKAENIGMPCSSTANDYFYAIDEINKLGYFVTDRHQPTGKVCIYTFVPNESRQVYQTEAYSEQQLRALADISSIADTWGEGPQRKQALNRLREAKAPKAQQTTGNIMSETENLRHQINVLDKAVTLARNFYARANDSERLKLRNEILNSEKELETLQTLLKQKEKEERNKIATSKK